MVITFFLSIFVNLKDKLWLAIIKEDLSNKKLLTDLESDTSGSLTALSSYERNKVKIMLGFIDKDRLALIV